MNIRSDGRDKKIANSAQCPSSGILDMEIGVSHHVDEERQRLIDEWCQHTWVGPFEDGPKSHDGCFALVPIFRLDVGFNEGYDSGNNSILNGTSE